MSRIVQIRISVQSVDHIINTRSGQFAGIRSILKAIAAASIYGACRCNGLSRLVDDVSEMARVAESRAPNEHQTLNKGLGLPAEPVSPSMFGLRLASDLKYPDELRQRARALAEQIKERGVTTGVHPAGFATACLYKAGREEGR